MGNKEIFKPTAAGQKGMLDEKSEEKNNLMSEVIDHETYHKTRQAYDEAELEVSGRYDRWVLTLSGGALGLSVTFIEKIAKNPTAETLFWLKFAWGFLILSLLFSLVSLVTSQSAIRENRKELDLAYSENRAPRYKFPRWFTWITNVLNWGSLLCFIVGVIFLCVFSFKNIDQKIIRTNGGIENGLKKNSEISCKKDSKRGNNRGGIRSSSASATKENPTVSNSQKGREEIDGRNGIESSHKKSPDKK